VGFDGFIIPGNILDGRRKLEIRRLPPSNPFGAGILLIHQPADHFCGTVGTPLLGLPGISQDSLQFFNPDGQIDQKIAVISFLTIFGLPGRLMEIPPN
jgi:hypothetical protein